MREHGLEPRLFCGGGWYIDEDVAAVLAELGYADCTATAFVPSYLAEDAPRLSAESPAWLSLPDGERLLELPSTHSLGMAARAAAGSLPDVRPRVLPRHGFADAKAPGGARVGARRARPALRGHRPRQAPRGLERALPSGPSP